MSMSKEEWCSSLESSRSLQNGYGLWFTYIGDPAATGVMPDVSLCDTMFNTMLHQIQVLSQKVYDRRSSTLNLLLVYVKATYDYLMRIAHLVPGPKERCLARINSALARWNEVVGHVVRLRKTSRTANGTCPILEVHGTSGDDDLSAMIKDLGEARDTVHPRSTLQGLPVELRARIWSYCVVNEGPQNAPPGRRLHYPCVIGASTRRYRSRIGIGNMTAPHQKANAEQCVCRFA